MFGVVLLGKPKKDSSRLHDVVRRRDRVVGQSRDPTIRVDLYQWREGARSAFAAKDSNSALHLQEPILLLLALLEAEALEVILEAVLCLEFLEKNARLYDDEISEYLT